MDAASTHNCNTRPAFAKWLLRQDCRDDAIGDLARDYRDDPDRPSSIRGLRPYLDTASGGWDPVLDAFDRAVAEWRKESR